MGPLVERVAPRGPRTREMEEHRDVGARIDRGLWIVGPVTDETGQRHHRDCGNEQRAQERRQPGSTQRATPELRPERPRERPVRAMGGWFDRRMRRRPGRAHIVVSGTQSPTRSTPDTTLISFVTGLLRQTRHPRTPPDDGSLKGRWRSPRKRSCDTARMTQRPPDSVSSALASMDGYGLLPGPEDESSSRARGGPAELGRFTGLDCPLHMFREPAHVRL